ncbi:zf-H2C2-2 domain-containing protein [Pyrenophora tritici-repentis]|nr:zf-H2C2-2 domain-containing protein [Pyrenophora tritici-repentis]KAI0583580.1 zf-H2C2-2 domain-containing protein [Pyrenophora tritici-repentis]KAI0607494.1 zf-H2C2-2 domain-containing protein [Pyrenophora tritici-repentis]KAI0619609.1 zf-H2C2-2 domain-containing protein [Pyrenophora tritici-repentis]KAI1677541.1 Zinc-finger double domain containing protein [Pyrenophora tritici-repentis]
MEQYGTIIEVFLNISDFVAFIWGPMKFLLLTARNYTDAFNSLLDMYLEIGESMPQFAQYQTLFQNNTHMQLALVNIYKDILEFHKEALRYFRQKKWQELFHTTWRPFSKTVAQLNKDMHRYKKLIENQISIAGYEAMQSSHSESMMHFEELKQVELHRKRLTVQQWLCRLDVQARHEDAIKNRHANSGDWLLQNSIFRKWYDFQSCWEPLLRLSGMPGAGKTILASRVIDACRCLPQARVAFFYCRNTDGDRNALVAVARTIISQLVVENDMLLLKVFETAQASGEAVLSSRSMAKTLLAIALQTFPTSQKTYIIIDGLDEYAREDRKEISIWFKEQPGMFLYAKLVMWNLHEQPTKKEFYREMSPEVFPDGLEQIYARIVDRIIGPTVQPISRRNSARKLLGWLACTKRALQWYEIQGAVSVDLKEGDICLDMRFEDDCKDLCASLVERTTDGSVMLVHSTAKMFLVNKGYISVPEVEFDLAQLCVTYLSLTQFIHPAEVDYIHDALYRGDYAFADYASCFWAYHVIEAVQIIHKLPSRKLEDLEEAINSLMDVQWASPKKSLVVSPTIEKVLDSLTGSDIYDSICQAVVSTKNQLLPTGKGPSDDEPLKLADAVRAIRTELESMVSSPHATNKEKKTLHGFYGTNLYKCPRLNCQFYWKGFAKLAIRDHHVLKHERSFMCTEEGCPQATIGCITAQDLQKHAEDCHGKVVNPNADFPDEQVEDAKEPQLDQNHPYFACPFEGCGKRFGQRHNLRSHSRTHTNEKPFSCSTCAKAFARRKDLIRHERGHSDKKLKCYGPLRNGETWGCGRAFNRGDELKRHFDTKTGRVCLQVYLEDNASQDKVQAQTSVGTLPSLNDPPGSHQDDEPRVSSISFEQYAILAGYRWNTTN